MLSIPNAYAKMGLAAGMCLSIGSGFISVYTICLLVHLYEERKRRLVSPAVESLGGTSNAVPGLFRRFNLFLFSVHATWYHIFLSKLSEIFRQYSSHQLFCAHSYELTQCLPVLAHLDG